MSKKRKPRKSEKQPSRGAAPKAVSKELSDGQLEDVTGGAFDAFINFSGPGDELPGEHLEINSFSWGMTQR